MFKKLFGKKPQKTVERKADEPLVPVPIPALITILTKLETETGRPLTETEVLELRDNAVCMMLPESAILELEKSRGYPDLHPQFVWEQWQIARQ